jgi:hypothetical protein
VTDTVDNQHEKYRRGFIVFVGVRYFGSFFEDRHLEDRRESRLRLYGDYLVLLDLDKDDILHGDRQFSLPLLIIQ